MKAAVMIVQGRFRVDARAEIDALAGVLGRSQRDFESIEIAGIEIAAPPARSRPVLVLFDLLGLQLHRGKPVRREQRRKGNQAPQ